MTEMVIALNRVPRLLLLAFGPIVTLALVQAFNAGASVEHPAIVAALVLAWSPFFFSVPALLLQHDRDEALPGLDGPVGSLVRGVVLLPYMLVRSQVRLETAVSLASWAVMVVLAWPALVEVASHFA